MPSANSLIIRHQGIDVRIVYNIFIFHSQTQPQCNKVKYLTNLQHNPPSFWVTLNLSQNFLGPLLKSFPNT